MGLGVGPAAVRLVLALRNSCYSAWAPQRACTSSWGLISLRSIRLSVVRRITIGPHGRVSTPCRPPGRALDTMARQRYGTSWVKLGTGPRGSQADGRRKASSGPMPMNTIVDDDWFGSRSETDLFDNPGRHRFSDDRTPHFYPLPFFRSSCSYGCASLSRYLSARSLSRWHRRIRSLKFLTPSDRLPA